MVKRATDTSAQLVIGIDAGTSVIKAVAFDLSGKQIGVSSVRNVYATGQDGSVTQSMPQTWHDCVTALRGLTDRIENLAQRTAAIAVTGQGDGTWLVDGKNEPVSDAWLWLDARAAPTVRELGGLSSERARFEATGTGLNTCQQGSQLAHIQATCPDLLDRADAALHCKDWVFLNLTGIRATDPSEASFTFGDFRNRQYSDTAIAALRLENRRHLLPEIIDGSQQTFALTEEAAQATGLLAGTPVSLGYVDMAMTALGGGVHTGDAGSACSTLGSTGVHMRAVAPVQVRLNAEGTGYVICLPVPGIVTQVQTNMAATLNLDWALNMARDLLAEFGVGADIPDLLPKVDEWMQQTKPGALVYHPYISEAGERGPFVNVDACASLVGMNTTHRFPEVVRSVIEGIGMAARDCYSAMGDLPTELRLTGGAARSSTLRQVLAAALNAPVRTSSREEAGAAGCAMMAVVAIGQYSDMNACIAEWVTPLLGPTEHPDASLQPIYDALYGSYRNVRLGLEPSWSPITDLQRMSR